MPGSGVPRPVTGRAAGVERLGPQAQRAGMRGPMLQQGIELAERVGERAQRPRPAGRGERERRGLGQPGERGHGERSMSSPTTASLRGSAAVGASRSTTWPGNSAIRPSASRTACSEPSTCRAKWAALRRFAAPAAGDRCDHSASNVTVGVSAPDATARFITEQGAPLKIIGATFQKNPFCILSIEQGTPIRTLADLAGKTVGIQAGTNQQIFAGFLKANGIDPASVKQVVVQYEPTPLTEKKVDGFMAFLTNEPFLVKSQGFTPVTLAFADNGLPLASETLVVLQDTIDKDRNKLKAFLKAEIQGWNDAVADPAAVALSVLVSIVLYELMTILETALLARWGPEAA